MLQRTLPGCPIFRDKIEAVTFFSLQFSRLPLVEGEKILYKNKGLWIYKKFADIYCFRTHSPNFTQNVKISPFENLITTFL